MLPAILQTKNYKMLVSFTLVFILILFTCSSDRFEQKKEEYVEKVKIRLLKIEDDILAWRERADMPKTINKLEFDKQLDALGEKENQAKQKLEQLKAASEKEWNHLQAEMDSLMREVEQAYEKTRSW